jgi:hypothetical protein
MTAEQLIQILTPLVVFGVVELVKWILPKVPGWALVAVIVPLLSAAVTLITQAFTGAEGFLAQFAWGFLAVFVNELVRQLKQLVSAGGGTQ